MYLSSLICFHFPFSEIIWVIIQVEDNGLLGVTQALSSFGGELTQQSPPGAQVVDNPFASPVKYFGSSPSSMSVLGQQGSAPGTPNTPHSQETTVLVPYITPSSNIRTALFQVSIITFYPTIALADFKDVTEFPVLPSTVQA